MNETSELDNKLQLWTTEIKNGVRIPPFGWITVSRKQMDQSLMMLEVLSEELREKGFRWVAFVCADCFADSRLELRRVDREWPDVHLFPAGRYWPLDHQPRSDKKTEYIFDGAISWPEFQR